jgi:hypothetical protein
VLILAACGFNAAVAADRPRAAVPSASPASHASPAHKRRPPGAAKRAAAPPTNKPLAGLVHSVKRGDDPLGKLLSVPGSQARVQAEKDLADTGTRARETHGLYEGDLDTRLRKAQTNDADSTPSFSIGRTTGIDAFTGRPQSARTEVKIGLTF